MLRPGMSGSQLLQAVRALHPEASKKEIIHAAFSVVVAIADDAPETARALQDFALRGHSG